MARNTNIGVAGKCRNGRTAALQLAGGISSAVCSTFEYLPYRTNIGWFFSATIALCSALPNIDIRSAGKTSVAALMQRPGFPSKAAGSKGNRPGRMAAQHGAISVNRSLLFSQQSGRPGKTQNSYGAFSGIFYRVLQRVSAPIYAAPPQCPGTHHSMAEVGPASSRISRFNRLGHTLGPSQRSMVPSIFVRTHPC